MTARSAIAELLVCMAVAFGQTDTDLVRKYRDQIKANPSDSFAHYLLAETYFRQQNYQTAANEFRESLNGNLQPKWVEVWSHLGLAKVFEIAGQQDRAVNEYRLAAATGDDTRGAQEVASAHLNPKNTNEFATSFPAAFRLRLRPRGVQPVQPKEAEYSEEARSAGLEGTVFVSLGITSDGTPVDLQVESPLGLGLDEKALEAVTNWRFKAAESEPDRRFALVAVNFLLPLKLSRWHLVGASFQTPTDVSRPLFLTEPYPLGAGISEKAIDEGSVINAFHRPATVTLQFDIDDRGAPANFSVLAASADLWGNEAIAVVRNWRFTPGLKDGKPVPVPCTLDLVWGQKVWTPESLAPMREIISATLNSDEHTDVRPSDAPRPPPKIKSIYEIEESTPRRPYSVIVSAIIGEDGVPIIGPLIRSLAPEYDAMAVDAIRKMRFKPPLLNGTPLPLPTLIEVDF